MGINIEDKVRFEHRLEEGEVVYRAQVSGKRVLGRRTAAAEVPSWMCLIWLRKSQAASMAGEEPLRWRVIRHEVREAWGQILQPLSQFGLLL